MSDIIKHPRGAFLWTEIASVKLIPSMASTNNAYKVTLKNGNEYELLQHRNGYTMEAFIEEWECRLKKQGVHDGA